VLGVKAILSRDPLYRPSPSPGRRHRRMRFATVETVTLPPIPCRAHLSPELYRARIAALVETIETDAACEREGTGASRQLRRSLTASLPPEGRIPELKARVGEGVPVQSSDVLPRGCKRAVSRHQALKLGRLREASKKTLEPVLVGTCSSGGW
jgi:hypothetical protein